MDSRSPPRMAEATPPTAAWQLRLLGALEVSRGASHLIHLPSRAVAALLARLALHPGRAHAREALVELLWPGVGLDVGRNRLRQTLSTLKTLLEAEGRGPVLQADRMSIRVVPGMLDCDVLRFEAALRQGQTEAALALYGGELMPGHYDDWVQEERQRLADLHERVRDRLMGAADPGGPPGTPAPMSAPVPTSLPQIPSGLPSYWTRSIGAELTASRLRVLVLGQRLVTVFGPGGSGKTRLAVEVAAAVREASGLALQDVVAETAFDRVAFVPLVDCVTAAQALDAICGSLQAVGLGEPRERIRAALTGGHTLLVLDNLEQLDAAASQEVAELLRGSPGLHVLATSRRLLDLDGEHAFEMDGLPLPPAEAHLQDALANAAVQLFADRARAARADFQVGAGNVRQLVALMRLLGGMPLAIELAASRVRSLTPAELLRHLSEDAGTPMLDLLSRSAQRATPGSRHASMRHVVDWSWRQLPPEQVQLLCTMSVLGAAAQAETVAAVAGISGRSALALLDVLVDASLVRVVHGAQDAPRFALQQPVREFASEQCAAQEARRARERLRGWLLVFAARVARQGPLAVRPELAHVHAAIVSAAADGVPAEGMRLALALRNYWDADDLPASCVQALEQSLPDLGTPGERSVAHELLAMGCCNAGLMAVAAAHADAAVTEADAAADPRLQALALTRWAFTTYFAGHFQADTILQALDRASARASESGDAFAQASVLRIQAPMRSNLLLDYAGSEVLAERAQALWEQVGHRVQARISLMGRATMWAWQGRNEEALPVLKFCEEQALAEGDWMCAINAPRQTGRVLIRLRRGPEALDALRRSVDFGWQRRSARSLANALLNLPEALLMAGQPEDAARLHAFAGAHWAGLYGAINRIETAEQKRTRRMLRLHLGALRLEALRQQGLGLQLPQAVALALGRGGA